MGHKGGHWQVHEECIVCTAVCQKAYVRLKRRRTMKNMIKPVALAIIELRLSEGINQLLTYLHTYSVNRKFRRIIFKKNSVATS